MRVTFPKDNEILYGQDFSWHRGIPDGIVFEAEKKGDYYVLTAPGYGKIGNYGNGALYVGQSKLDIKDFEVKSETDVLKARIAKLETLVGNLGDALTATYNSLPTHWRDHYHCPYSYSGLMLEIKRLKVQK